MELERWFCSKNTGKIVRTRLEILQCIIESIRKNYGFIDCKWEVVWL